MMSLINKRLYFLAKYGTDTHRAEFSKHIDDVLDGPYHHQRDYIYAADKVASHTDLPLTSHQVHKIIDTKNPPDLYMTHPMVALARWHFGDLKEEHWDKIAKTASDKDVLGIVPHMPHEHVAKIAADTNREPFVRQTAARHYRYAKLRDEAQE